MKEGRIFQLGAIVILLSPQQETKLQDYTGRPFNRPDDFKDMPVLAILKSYIDSAINFLPHMIRRMAKNIISYHNVGIYLQDIYKENYLDGILFDLSRAVTVPHPDLTPVVVKQLFDIGLSTETPNTDYQYFDNMIDDWNHENPDKFIWFRFLPNLNYVNRFRSFDRSDFKAYTKRLKDRHRIAYRRPEFYKWQKK